MNKHSIICRCNDLTYEDIVSAIHEGYTTLEELKRHLRMGMGPCQGRTCLPLAAQILAKKTDRSLDRIELPTSRPPFEPTPFYLFSGGMDDER